MEGEGPTWYLAICAIILLFVLLWATGNLPGGI